MGNMQRNASLRVANIQAIAADFVSITLSLYFLSQNLISTL